MEEIVMKLPNQTKPVMRGKNSARINAGVGQSAICETLCNLIPNDTGKSICKTACSGAAELCPTACNLIPSVIGKTICQGACKLL
jgi:hypothetical protein